ncbi:nucleotide exchange factor GrpE [Actinomadura barringtoniae]|uniref:Protein GrpE n=1 Tax=Actinomadura barringtoniae TaxID=1427535 RepID=A0A939P9W5_9ACTN|nr:nucleotide exchange factor GrpE [Actinomadura barringtoniae]MBO2448625.1 nucleotide exchange factor GrpE [Actinomadura barringtoniae]
MSSTPNSPPPTDPAQGRPDERVAELEDLWRRTAADLDNARKRFARDLERERRRERARVAAEWLPLLDDLERALEHARSDPESIVAGVQAVRDQAVRLLERLGFPRRDDIGAPFDPARHEAVVVRDDTGAAPGTVVEVLRPGYGDGEAQLRPALVAVASKDEVASEDAKDDR